MKWWVRGVISFGLNSRPCIRISPLAIRFYLVKRRTHIYCICSTCIKVAYKEKAYGK